jgi:alpha-amylase/alpha-mannosidase (GH57 family)
LERYVCIHGHFYQPPRENPWLEAIEVEDSAYPYHDWNERVNAQCYAPNTASRILDPEGRIAELPNNYSSISFNFGPTLLSWLEEKAPEVYGELLAADRISRKAFSGHGNAMAQAYNHMIMPLANPRDKYTQVVWGLRDFEHRYGRTPEGMWLPETAVDLESLDIMAELGVKFTVLAPHQAARVRNLGETDWQDVSGGTIDPRQPYVLNLPSGRTINIFFYDGPISRAVAFENLLSKGEDLANRLLGAFTAEQKPQLVHIATDGETYGHHQRFGDMALAYALKYLDSEDLAHLTNYGEYLEKFPPASEVEILEQTSWSCAHGLERWWSDCGCASGGHPGWNQAWRTPLRNALDWLRDTLAPIFEEKVGQFLKDPWAARNDYIQVILDRSPATMDQFLSSHASRELSEAEKVTTIKMLGVQRCALLMYTSCGWFFDDLSGLESVQVIHYAGRALKLAAEAAGKEIEEEFLKLLEQAKSNLPEHGDGRQIYERWVKPAMLDLPKVAAHYGVSSLFKTYAPEDKIYCYFVNREDYQTATVGNANLALGRVLITSEVTRETARLNFVAAHFGEHNLVGAVQEYQDEVGYANMVRDVMDGFAGGDFAEAIRQLDRHFGASTYSIKSLFRDEQRQVLARIMEAALQGTRFIFRQIYQSRIAMMLYLHDLRVPLPEPLPCISRFVLNYNLNQDLASDEIGQEVIRRALDEARALNVKLDAVGLGYISGNALVRLAQRLREAPGDFDALQKLETMAALVRALPFEVNLWKVQNIYFELLHTVFPDWRWRARHGDEQAYRWVSSFTGLGAMLSVRVPDEE